MNEVKAQDTVCRVVTQPLPQLQSLPSMLPLEGAVRLELEDGVPVFRAAEVIQDRIDDLVTREHRGELNSGEVEELDRYEEIDDYLSFVNRLIRNLSQSE